MCCNACLLRVRLHNHLLEIYIARDCKRFALGIGRCVQCSLAWYLQEDMLTCSGQPPWFLHSIHWCLRITDVWIPMAHSTNVHHHSVGQKVCSALVLLHFVTSWIAQSNVWIEDLNRAFPWVWNMVSGYLLLRTYCEVMNKRSLLCRVERPAFSHNWLCVFMLYNRNRNSLHKESILFLFLVIPVDMTTLFLSLV